MFNTIKMTVLALALALPMLSFADHHEEKKAVTKKDKKTMAKKDVAKSEPEATEEENTTIVGVATSAGNFTTLVKALEAADLVGTLEGDGPYTVFAPTDEAFAKIPEKKLNALLADKEKLTKVLTYHVVPGKVMAADVVKMKKAKTVEGDSLKIKSKKGVKVDNATVEKTDIEASNGVIHVIDTVLMP